MMIQMMRLVVLSLALSIAVGSPIKGLEQAPSKGSLEAPAAKGRVLERQQQQQQRLETVDELPKEQLKAAQEELQVTQVDEVRATKGGAARKQDQLKQQEQLAAETQEKLDEPAGKTRLEARPAPVQVQQQQQQQQFEEQAKLAEAPLEQQRTETLDRQELVELRLPEEQQRKLPESFPAQQQQQIIYQQQREEELQQQQVKAEAEPYSFSYAVDGSSRSESGDTRGVVRGQYTLQGADGSRRIVDYIADQDGFRASINTNEFGTEARSPAGVALRSSQPSAEDITLRLEGKTREAQTSQQQVAVVQQQEQYKEYAGVKGAPAKGLAPAPAQAQTQPLLLPILQEPEPIPAAVKRPAAARKEAAQQEPLRVLEESSKSAELSRREPKVLKGVESAHKETRSSYSFESATAHRDYRPRQVQALARQQFVPATGVRYQPRPVQPPTRAVQYPVSPVQAGAGYRRYPGSAEARNPRVSFYAPPAITSEETGEQPIAGFDSRSA